MAQPKGPVGFILTDHSHPGVSSFLTSQKRVDQWVASLPRAHIGETSKLIYQALRELNQYSLASEQRLAVLLALTEPIDYVVRSLRKHVLGQAFPLTPKKQKVAQLIRELLGETAVSYRIYLENILNEPQATRDIPNIVLALQRAIYYDMLLLLNTYQTYSSHPPGTWLEMHRLYTFALQHDLHKIPVVAPASLSHGDTVDDTYKRVLLLALVNPYQLSQTDIQRIYDSLYFWSPFCGLTPLNAKSSSRSMFAVNPNADDPPTYYAYCTLENRQCLLLDTRTLTQKVREVVTAASVESYPPPVAQLGRDTLKRMLLSWGSLSKRAFTRRDNAAKVNVTLGLSRTFSYLSKKHQTANQTAAGERSTYISHTVQGADGSEIYPAMWDMNDKTNGHTAVPSVYDQPKGNTRAKSGPTYYFGGGTTEEVPIEFNITNESAGGYCLLWKQSAAGTLMVGDMVCMHDTASSHSNICVIRWMKNLNETMVLGIEILSPCAEPVAVRIVHGDGAHGELTPSLLLPPVDAVKRPVALLVPSTFRSGDILELTTSDGQRTIRLTYLQQATRTFKQFQFSDVIPDEPKSESDGAPGFDSIWSSL